MLFYKKRSVYSKCELFSQRTQERKPHNFKRTLKMQQFVFNDFYIKNTEKSKPIEKAQINKIAKCCRLC